MTPSSRPKPSHSAKPQREQVITSITLQLGRSHYEAMSFDGGETTILSVETILDQADQPIQPIWERDWTEVAPGIRTKQDAVEIQRTACPVTVSFKQERFGRVYKDKTDTEERYSVTEHFQIQYEAKRAASEP